MTAALDFLRYRPKSTRRVCIGAGSAPMLATARLVRRTARQRTLSTPSSANLSTLTVKKWHGPASSMTAAAAPTWPG